MNNSIYEVLRSDYVGFVEQIKPDCRKTEIVEIGNNHIATKTISIKTGKCLCSRVSYSGKPEDEYYEPEKYYIFEMPDNDERQAPIPKYQLKLETKEEVQAFFDFLSKQNKEKHND